MQLALPPANMGPQSSRPSAVDPRLTSRESTVEFRVDNETFQTWYKVFGNLEGSKQPPLVILHGGPGECLSS
jgi:hypothetical protein